MTTKRKRDGLWFAVATRFARNAKVLAAGGDAVLLWLFCMGYAREELTDGFVPRLVVATYGGVKQPLQKAARLVAVGMLEETERGGFPGFQVHGFEDWAETRAEVESRRAGATERQRLSRQSRRDRDHLSQRDSDPGHADVTLQSRAEQSRAEQIPADAGSARARDPDDDPGENAAETRCPLDLQARAEAAGVLRDLADHLPAPLESVADSARRMVGYYTLGRGRGQLRLHWMLELREWVRRDFEAGRLRPPGALQHATTQAAGMSAAEAKLAAIIGSRA